MDGNMTLQQAHDITSRIEGELNERFGSGTIVTLHMEPLKDSNS